MLEENKPCKGPRKEEGRERGMEGGMGSDGDRN